MGRGSPMWGRQARFAARLGLQSGATLTSDAKSRSRTRGGSSILPGLRGSAPVDLCHKAPAVVMNGQTAERGVNSRAAREGLVTAENGSFRHEPGNQRF